MHYFGGHVFSYFFDLVDVVEQVAMRTVLQNHVVVMWSLDNVIAFDNVVMLDLLVDFYLGFQHLKV